MASSRNEWSGDDLERENPEHFSRHYGFDATRFQKVGVDL